MLIKKIKKKVVSFSLEESQYELFRKIIKLQSDKQSSVIDFLISNYINIQKPFILQVENELAKGNITDDEIILLINEIRVLLDAQ